MDKMDKKMVSFNYFNTFDEFSKTKISTSMEDITYGFYELKDNIVEPKGETFQGKPDVSYYGLVWIGDINVFWTHGIFYYGNNTSNLITFDEFSPVSTNALNSIQKGTLGTINGESLEDGDITLDLNLFKIVSELPTENILDNKIYLIKDKTSTDNKNTFNEYIYTGNSDESSWELLGQITSEIDLSGYLTKEDAEKKYVKKSENTNSSITTGSTGSMSNFGDNGQAYLAVRQKGAKFIINAPYAGASFGVKDDGTTAFSHKTYQTFNKDTGAYTGAKNTAVLQFAGPTGLRYAKNTGSGNDVTDDMYKYVGVIDSPDERQKVYSASQVDSLLKSLTDKIDALENRIKELEGSETIEIEEP